LWSWGRGGSGRLGDGTAINCRTTPVQEISSSTNWCQASAGNLHSSAVKTDGTIWSWGGGACGRLGDGAAVNRTSPVQEISASTKWFQVSAGNAQSAAIKLIL
jgi:alpha-tubulin suppressor-like RCC1 family protein